MTRNARHTDELEEIPLFREEGEVELDATEALQEEVEELLGDDDDLDPEVIHEEHDYIVPVEPLDWEPSSGGGSLTGYVLGGLLAAAGVALGAGPTFGFGSLTETLTGLGIEAGTLVTVGLVLVFLAGMRGSVRGNATRMADLEQVVANQAAELQHSVDYLVEQQRFHGERPPASGEELDRVLVVMQRLDEKINNLTKAFKMYGKPLVEISNQSTDIAAEVNEVRTLVEATRETLAQGFQRSDKTLKEVAEGGAVQEGLRATVDQVQQAMQTGFGQLQEALRTVAEQVGEHKKLGAALEKLEKRLDEATGKLLQGIEQAGGSGGEGTGDLEGPIREIQREVAGLATTLASLQHKVGSGGGGGGAGGARYAPQEQAPAAAGPAAPAVAGKTPSTGLGTAAGGVLAQSIAGTKKAAGKNVLGAIAKLRQMRN